ncbi:MAG: caspase family protein [Bacteroidales bacterium]|nr:caspase family protein [Bacteroidales bacterium]
MTASSNNVKIWETISGRPVHNLVGHKWSVIKAAFSPSGEKIITGDVKGVLKVWNGQTGNYLYDLSGHKSWIQSIQFSADEDKVLTSSIEGKVKMWNSKTGNLIFDFCGHTNEVLSANFSFNEHFIITTGSDNKIILWDATTGKMLYTRLQLTNNDWLVYDEHYRYDGSAGARDYLYFVCGLEIIDLAQLKDALYVPGLVEKIMSGQEINYPKLSGLEICDALPLIEQIEHSEHTFHYKITPRKLPLEYVEVYVNDKKIRNVFTHELNRKEDSFYLILDDDEIKRHFIHGGENKVKVVGIVRQKGSELRSRGAEYVEIDKSPPLIPRLYALMIGVSDYKDDRLDLVYPSKDASDLGKAVEMSAKKMLGDDNVFIYMVHSDVTVNNGFSTPEKEGIRRALQDIGSKARPVDVVLVFFAGHGTMQGTKDNMFTFLTSETSEINQVGISIKELQSWLSYDGPHRMLANKTILIFDACHSGQAIKELTAMIRTDDDTRRIRQVEDLKDKSGVFILAAAASDQQAYEMGLYEQGLLTYSLLHTMKYNPEVLEEWRFLNVQKWFLESEKFLQDLVRSRNLHQQAQPFGTANIRIGEVDDEVKNSIRLAEEKPVVVCANIFNDATSNDDLRLKILISDKLMEISKRGVDKSIAYASYETESANRINIRYTINADNVACDVRLYKQGELLHNTIIKGTTNNLEALAAKIIEEIVGHAK